MIRPARSGRIQGFSMLELVVVIVIIALLMAVAVSKYLALAVDAERVAMENVLGSLRSAVSLKMTEAILRGNIGNLWQLETSNPMERLAEVPSNYIGQLDNPDPASVKGGAWYFDLNERALIYRVRNESNFQTDLAGPPRARFGIRIVFEDRNGNSQFDPAVDKVEGLRLAALESYSWINLD